MITPLARRFIQNGRLIYHCKQNIAAKKSFDLKSNSQYFDLKSHLDHVRKNDLIRSKIFKKIYLNS
jgi:hypothetical protein